jgi:hypothetical protein
MNQQFSLDVQSLQKLLEAVWVLQCERDRELSESHNAVTVLRVSSDKEGLNRALALTLPGNVFEPVLVEPDLTEAGLANAEAHTPPICEVVDPSIVSPTIVDPNIVEPNIVEPNIVPRRPMVAPIYQGTEVAGALALAADHHCAPAVAFSAPEVLEEAARGKNRATSLQMSQRVTLRLVRSGDKYRVALRLVPTRDEFKDKEHALSTRTAAVFKRASRATTEYAGPVAVLVIMLVFVFSLLGIRRPAVTAVQAAPLARKLAVADSPARDYAGKAVAPIASGSGDPRSGAPVLESPAPAPTGSAPTGSASAGPGPVGPEPSHMRVTDLAASSLVQGLSLYELETVRRQAQYGDDIAALTLGMAYEIGHHVPQSCAEAAHWIAVAAAEGNSAAQYNLGLRYLSGDGTPTNPDEARKWFEKAARHGYQKARVTMQASGL